MRMGWGIVRTKIILKNSEAKKGELGRLVDRDYLRSAEAEESWGPGKEAAPAKGRSQAPVPHLAVGVR